MRIKFASMKAKKFTSSTLVLETNTNAILSTMSVVFPLSSGKTTDMLPYFTSATITLKPDTFLISCDMDILQHVKDGKVTESQKDP